MSEKNYVDFLTTPTSQKKAPWRELDRAKATVWEMSEGREKLTLRHHEPRLFGAGRYVTSGAPRPGGIANVFSAREVQTGAHVALKVFRPTQEADDVIQESFRREVKALSDLKHDNIVRIIDSGAEATTGEHFIAMEWVAQDLDALRKGRPYESWDNYYFEIGQQILQAIAFGHSKSVVHRDIKPANILVAGDGTVKVCDFGIAKLRSFLEPGVTLAHFASMPFSPPEPDDGSFSYSRDVFGFAALSVVMVAAMNAKTHADLHRALDSMKVQEPIRRMLRKCLSLDNPADRPVNAAVLLAELERLQPRKNPPKSGSIIFGLTKKVKDIISYDIGLSSEEAIGRYVSADLGNAACEYTTAPPNAGGEAERSILIFGDRYGYVAVRDAAQPGILKLVSCNDPPTFELERSRDGATPFTYEVAFGGLPMSQSVANIAALRQRLEEFSAEQKLQKIEQLRQQLFRTWLDLLSAKTDLENSRKVAYRYVEHTVAGGILEIRLMPGADASPLEDLDVRIETGDGTFLGTVIGSQGDVIRVLPSERNRVAFTSLSATGLLSTDTARADAAIDKQRVAVDAVRYGRSVDPALCDHIMDPSAIGVPAPVEVEFIQTHIDDDKKEAVRAAVAAPPLMVVEGPPGTGKTTFITELVLQVVRADPSARILLTSQTHVALDNSLERITKESGGKVQAVRIGHESDERIAPSSKELLVDKKLPVMRRDAIARGKVFIEKWAEDRGVDLSSTRMAMALGRHAGLCERLEQVDNDIARIRGVSREEREALSAEERDELDEQLAGLVREMESIERDVKESVAEFRKYETDKETIQHLSECSPMDLRSWADTYAPQTQEGVQLKKLLAAHADWEARFGRGREFKAALIASSQVVAGTCLGVMAIPGRKEITYDLCIVDEASIATPTEVLVPMSRARRTVLVGDNRQLSPFQDPDLVSRGHLKNYGLTKEDQQKTLFKHLTDSLPPSLHKTLTSQHRMLKEIGDLISHCFYLDGLHSVSRAPDPVLAAALPKAVTWKSTSSLQKRASSKVGTSHFNNLEVQLIERILTRLDFDIQHGKWKGQTRSVAVLTGYGEQKRRLQTAIDLHRHGWNSFSNIFVNVVDAFQGREADVAIFSVTRSDAVGLGFLREMERINVALSRGKERLIIVGDHSYCLQAQDSENPLKDVIKYIDRNPAACCIEAAQS